jgi:hypothetical protein
MCRTDPYTVLFRFDRIGSIHSVKLFLFRLEKSNLRFDWIGSIHSFKLFLFRLEKANPRFDCIGSILINRFDRLYTPFMCHTDPYRVLFRFDRRASAPFRMTRICSNQLIRSVRFRIASLGFYSHLDQMPLAGSILDPIRCFIHSLPRQSVISLVLIDSVFGQLGSVVISIRWYIISSKPCRSLHRPQSNLGVIGSCQSCSRS